MARIRVFLRIPNDDAYELKAQALNNDPRLKAAGISALKFEDDQQYIADGEFSDGPPPPFAPEPFDAAQDKPGSGERLRVVIRLSGEDAYELKAQALNNDPRLKEAGISALKFESDKQYIFDGEFSEEPPAAEIAPAPAPGGSKSQPAEGVRIYLRVPREDAYHLLSSFLNGDPRLKEAGIAGVNLVKGGGVPAPSDQPRPAPKKKRSGLRRILVWGLLIAILATAGVAFAAPGLLAPFVPPEFLPPFVVLPTGTSTAAATTATAAPLTPTPSHTPTVAVPTKTRTPVPTQTGTSTPEPVSCILPQEGTIQQQLNCRWGPGSVYIYRDGAYPGEQVQILGRAETVNGTWIYVQLPREPTVQCWINSDPRFIDYEGEVACLEPYYPGKARELRFSHANFPPPSDVSAVRAGDQVNIYWTGQSLAPGDRPDEGQPPFAPVYLVEAWTCQAGKIVFTPLGVYTEDMSGAGSTFPASTSVRDEAGCSEPSHARVFLAHKDGYVGPVEVPWPTP